MLNNDQKNDFNALLPGRASEAGASRRSALKAALGVGYAAAAPAGVGGYQKRWLERVLGSEARSGALQCRT
jgi:hypothetical protein